MPPWSKIDLTHCNTFFPLNDEHWICAFNVREQPCALETSFRSIDKINYGNVSVDALATVVCVVERWPCNHEVPRSSPGSGSQLWDFSLAHTFGASTGVVPRKQNRERLV